MPAPRDAVIRQMVDDFKHWHRRGKVDIETVRPFVRFSAKLEGSYSRYSCDNSDLDLGAYYVYKPGQLVPRSFQAGD